MFWFHLPSYYSEQCPHLTFKEYDKTNWDSKLSWGLHSVGSIRGGKQWGFSMGSARTEIFI